MLRQLVGRALRARILAPLRRLKALFRPNRLLAARRLLARKYLCGTGIEVGALHHPLPVPASARVRYVDRLSVDELRRQYPDLAAEPLVPVDIVTDGETLAGLADGSQGFVIANHFLEHCEDPIGALKNFVRVLRPGGVAYVAVPDKRFTFDRDRPLTPLVHLIADHRDGPAASRRAHFEEYARFVLDQRTDAAVTTMADHLMERNHSIHFHVWSQREVMELLVWLQATEPFDAEIVCKNETEVICILRKHAA